MAFIDLTKLRTLDLAGNSLTELNDFWFENLQDLTKLLLSFNLLQSAFQGELTCFSSLSKLQHLDLSFNYGHNTYPQTVKLSNSFSKLRSLQVLHLVCLVFREIVFDTLKPLVSLKNLTELYLGTNFIVHSNSTIFKELPQLKVIFLSENRLYPVSVSTANAPGRGGNVNANLISSPQQRFPPLQVEAF